MPEITVIHLGLLGLMLVIGAAIGWFVRGDRCAKEKIAVNASWQEQLESQQSEHKRLAEQNKSLMEQISQYQASHQDYSNRAKELSESLREAFARRDEMQRQLKDMRGKLEVAVAQRNSAREQLQKQPRDLDATLREKDDKIFQLSRELTSWQSRVPPLVEKFQEKNRECQALEEELEEVCARLASIEENARTDGTRIEPVDAESLPDGGDASNEPNAMTSAHETAELQDQLDDEADSDGGDDEGNIVAVSDFAANTEEDGDGHGAADDFTDVFASSQTIDASQVIAVDDNPDDSAGAPDASAPASGANGGNTDGPASSAGTDDERDDLKMIKGIGPSIERTLNGLGVFRFHQLAEMSEYDIDRVAQQIRGFRSRIYREDWIGQARDLQYQKNNEHS
jgi:predicted flap endonuclease-1-like 5' DNA nuclease